MSEKKSKNLILIITLVILLLILIGGGLALYFLKSDATKETKVDKEKIKQFQTNNPILSKELGGDEEALDKIGPLYQLDPFTVNLLSENKGEKYLIVTLSLELSSKELENELIAKKAVIRNLIINILSSDTIESISSDAGKEKVSLKIVDNINDMLSDGKIKNVYFTKFVTQ